MHFPKSAARCLGIKQTNEDRVVRPVKNRDGPIAGIPHTGGGGSRQSGPDDNDPVSATTKFGPPTTASFLHHTTTVIGNPLLFHPSSRTLHRMTLSRLKYPYSPPSSTLSPPLTPCQSSPPSETDDLCSACKGAGEFVICDHCPRVFHFLCCDPPMLEAPTGSFSCYECSVKLKPAEEIAADSLNFTPLGPLFRGLDAINTRAFALPPDVQGHFEDVAARPDGSYFEETRKFPL